MGVHTLWNILEETGEENFTVRSLRGKKLAVDLSAWVVELQQSKISTKFRNAYIRNLFYRTVFFMKEGVELVFVTDGRAPELKQQALLTRQQNQFGSSSSTAGTDRLYLRNAASKCVEMLGYLGLPCVQAAGEAEAMCAYLNNQQLVDGCLTEDNDFFLYGGKTLYRKLTQQNKMYVVEKFDMDRIKADLFYERRDLVALALLLGSDYNEKGVKRVGKERGKALVELLKSRKLEVLDRLLGWRNNKELDSVEKQLSAATTHKPHCSTCDHLGRVSLHEASGCCECRTDKGCKESCEVTCQCAWHQQEALRKRHKLELSLRQKSLQNKAFPDEKVIQEYLNPCLQSCKEIPTSSMNVPKLMVFMNDRLGWSSDKVLEKIVPIVILKELREKRRQSDLMFTPVRILRSCKENHIDCYEVAWDKTDKNDWAGTNFSTNTQEKVEKSLLESIYPTMVTNFELSLAQKKTASGKKRKSETGKGQLKLTQYTKIKKKLHFDEVSNGKTQKMDFVSIDDNVIDLTNVNSNSTNETSKSKGRRNNTTVDLSKVTEEDLDTRLNVETGASCSTSTLSTSCQIRKSLQNGTGSIDAVQRKKHVTGKLQPIKSNKKAGSGKRKKDKTFTADSPQVSIMSFFARKETKSDTRAVEFKQNDTTAFKASNN